MVTSSHPSITISSQATRLKKIRLYLGMTRQALGEKINISPYTLRSWENGHKNFVASSVKRVIENLKKINFSCDFEWLMHGKGESPIARHEAQAQTNPARHRQSNSIAQHIKRLTEQWLNADPPMQVITVNHPGLRPFANLGDLLGVIPLKPSEFSHHLQDIIYWSDEQNPVLGILTKTASDYAIQPLLASTLLPLPLPLASQPIYRLVWLGKALLAF